MKIKLFGFVLSNEKSNLSKIGASSKVDMTKKKILSALYEIETNKLKYSEYRLQKISGLSINTIKKYREFIEIEKDNFKGIK